MSGTPPFADGLELMRAFLPQSPFVMKLGVVAESLRSDLVQLRMPWHPHNVTVGDMVHGGALAGLVDIVAMAAAWCGAPLPDKLRGVTTSMAVEFVYPAIATDVLGTGRVLRRGRTLVQTDIVLALPDAATVVAKGIATYKIG